MPVSEFQPDDGLSTEEAYELANTLETTKYDAYAQGREDQLTDDIEILKWAYSKLAYRSFDNMDDALMMDRIKNLLMYGQ